MIKNLGGAALGLAWVLASGCNGAQAKEPEPLQGVVELDERVLGFEVGGRLQTVDVEEGARVEPGQIIARLDDSLERIARDARVAEAWSTAALVLGRPCGADDDARIEACGLEDDRR